jgi:hypothetical protein
MQTFHIEMIENTPSPILRRIGDKFLMDHFLLHGFKGKALSKLNRCRLYLQVNSLADIASADGKWITHEAWFGKLDESRPHYYSWPNQGDPPPRDWAFWRQALSLSFCNGQERRLALPLGSWKDERKDAWTWFFAPAEDRLYERVLGTWNVYSMEGGRTQRTNKRFLLQGTTDTIPDYSLRATVFPLDPGRYVLSNYGWDAIPAAIDNPTSLAAAISQLPLECRWAVQRFDAPDNGMCIALAIQQGTAIAVSDGSFKDGRGTAAIIIEAADTADNIIIVNAIPGDPESQSSYRSELAGIFGQVIMVNTICRLHGVTQGSITSGCDGAEAIRKAFDPQDEARCNSSQFDLLSAIWAALKDSPITWHHRHVKGHQDEEVDTILDRWALLNIQMDGLAKSYWMETYHQPLVLNTCITGEYWPVFIQGRKIHSSLRSTLYNDIYQRKMGLHWEKHDRFTQEQCMRINWDACAGAMRRLKISRRNWIVKHTEGMCGVGKWLMIWKDSDSDACPLCSGPEDARHVWQCPDNRAQVIRNKGIATISTWMDTAQTDPGIKTAISSRLHDWLSLQPITPIPHLQPTILEALHLQDDIGWENFFEGCVAMEWEAIQDEYYSWCKSTKSGRRWTIALIQKLWDIAWDLWEHRIGIVHDTANAELLHNMAEVDNNIRTQFTRGPQGLATRDHALFNGYVEDILSSSILYRTKWLERVEKARERAARRHLTTYSQERQALNAWLHGLPGPHTGGHT